MNFDLTFYGAAERVTGSLYLIETDEHKVLLECGMFQGGRKDEALNREPFPVSPEQIDAVVLSHAHIDHSGRVPLLVSQGFTGPIYTQHATLDLCEIMLPDSGYLHEKDAEWENRRRGQRRLPPIRPLYTRAEAESCLRQFRGVAYDESVKIASGLSIRFIDAGHILGSAIVELKYAKDGESRSLVFSGDLGGRDAPVMRQPGRVGNADLVLMESTYGDRLHRTFSDTVSELSEVFEKARAAGGNILIPSFAVGRTQDILYLLSKYSDEWGLQDWHVFLDSPMAIQATEIYSRHRDMYDSQFFESGSFQPRIPNFHMTRTTEESMSINQIRSGAIIIAGSGMCTGGRIRHHLKNNIWRPENHVVIVGYQAYGTLGRRLVDGSDTISLWGDTYRVRSSIHTIGGLSAHGDQADLIDWYGSFRNTPPVYLVHGEPDSQKVLASEIVKKHHGQVAIAKYGQRLDLANIGRGAKSNATVKSRRRSA